MSMIIDPAETARRELGTGFEGELIGPGDPDYDTARALFNAMIDKRPAVIARCSSPADVARVVGFARAQDLPLAVRGGGHNGGGLGSVDDGVVADLSLMRSVSVDPGTRTVRVGGGSTWAEVDAATHEHGLAVPCGVISTTGVGGLTLGGGIGHLTRGYGLTVDNLLGAEVVLSDGQLVRASADENAELFWALRGGGGNFGVVTEFTFRAHPVSDIVGGPTFWPIEHADELLAAYREYLPTLLRNVGAFFNFHTIPPGPPFPEKMPSWKCGSPIYPIDGAAHDVGPDETPWAYRDTRWSQVIIGVDPDPASAPALRDWAVGYWEALHPYSAGGAYVNFMMDEGQERVKATYGGNYDRLAKAKASYDPQNVFRVNQNIQPAV